MYRSILLILYLLVLIPSLTHMISHRDDPVTRRLSAGFGAIGTLLAPKAAFVLCEVFSALFQIILLLLIFIVLLKMLFSSIFDSRE